MKIKINKARYYRIENAIYNLYRSSAANRAEIISFLAEVGLNPYDHRSHIIDEEILKKQLEDSYEIQKHSTYPCEYCDGKSKSFPTGDEDRTAIIDPDNKTLEVSIFFGHDVCDRPWSTDLEFSIKHCPECGRRL